MKRPPQAKYLVQKFNCHATIVFTLFKLIVVWVIVIKPDPGVDPAKGPGLGFHGSTQKNYKEIKILIFHMKKIHVNIDYTYYEV